MTVESLAAGSPSLLADAMLSCEGLRVGYGDIEIVSGFSLSCRPGEIVSLIGPNGCGKSTLLKGLCGLLRPSAGTVRVSGLETTALPPDQVAGRGVEYVPQIRDVFPSLTVLENLHVGIADDSRMTDVLSLFPVIKSLLHVRAGKLSGGERKSLAIARAFMNPKVQVLMLDEPSAGLSPVATAKLWPSVRAASEGGLAVLVVEQRVDEVLATCDRAYVMVEGQNRLAGSATELLADRDLLAQVFTGG
jgi:ABC-type branched-subunit amino acid transport system ATPase component